jgi:flagellar hook-associated protein 3 FlgL
MITRVSTAGSYSAVLTNLANAESQQMIANNQVSSQKVAQDLKGFAGQAETLTAMQAVQSKVDGLLSQNTVLANRYTDQDTALGQIGTAAQDGRTAVADALSSNNADTLMQQLQGAFSDAVSGLNFQSQGTYLFAGGQVNTAPVTAQTMSDLTTPAATTNLKSIFTNDNFVASNQITETSSVQGGQLANNVGQPLMAVFQDIQAYQNTNGPFTGQLTTAQQSFLQGEMAKFDTAYNGLVNNQAQNGAVQSQITGAATALTSRQTQLQSMIGSITDVNMADAVSRLQTAQVAVQASAQVFSALQSSSLLNYLPVS